MAQYSIPDSDDLLECPYDKVHLVRAKRFQYHLMKCRNNYKGREYMTCPFNAKHEMPKPEYRHHIQHCPDKALIEPELRYQERTEEGDDSILKGCTDIPTQSDMIVPQTENWDEEAAGAVRVGVEPSHFSRVRFLNIGGMSTGEKRKMRQEGNLPNEEKMKNLMADLQVNGQQNGADDGGSLRLPKSTSYAAMANQPQIRPREQPTSAVFAYSIGRGRGKKPISFSTPTANGTEVGGTHTNGTISNEIVNGVQNGLQNHQEATAAIIYQRDASGKANPSKPEPVPTGQPVMGRGRGRGSEAAIGRGIGMKFVPPPPGFGGLGRGNAWGSFGSPALPEFVVPKVDNSVTPNADN